MNTTKAESFAVESSAWLTRVSDKRRLAIAMIIAPVAPIAPPSVGVARPMKIVPSTRKISPSGGISTMMTSCDKRESNGSFSSLFASATM